jgi:hypothetical protein
MVCVMLSERIEIERQERRVLVEAVTSLAQRDAIEAPPKPRILGGTVYATPAELIDATETGDGSRSCWSPVTPSRTTIE